MPSSNGTPSSLIKARWISLVSVLALMPGMAWAALTPAGTVISNIAAVTYTLDGGGPDTTRSNEARLVVDEIINVTLTWQDAAPVSVNSPGVGDVLTFLLTNTGNGREGFRLTRNNLLSGDQYDPVGSLIYLENGLAPGLQTSGPNADVLYIAGVNDPVLGAERSLLVYLVSDTPGGLDLGAKGLVALTAASVTPGAAGAAPGTALPGLGVDGVAAIVGNTRAQATREGSYIVSGLTLKLTKTVEVLGGGEAAPGKTLRYTLLVELAGAGVVKDLVITDPLPAELTYLANSITVDAASRTDAADADNAQFTANTLTVNFGDTAAPRRHVITFSATVK